MIKHVLKCILAFALVPALAVPLICGCRTVSLGTVACESYMEYIRSGEYSNAYALLSPSVQNETDTPDTDSVTEQEFIDKYNNIFDGLQITGLEYSNVRIDAGDILATASYDVTYHSTLMGDITESITLTAQKEGGVWHIAWSPALIFDGMEWGDTVRVARVAASRGEILAGTTVLASTAGLDSVYVQPSRLADRTLAVTQLATLTGESEEAINKKLDAATGDLAIIKQYYPGELAATAEAQLLLIEGVGVDDGNYGAIRNYPCGSLLAHTVGYVGAISAATTEELDEEIDRLNTLAGDDGAYTSDSIVGKLGLERQYETELRGTDGTQVYIYTAEGTNRRTIYYEAAQDGLDIQLTVNAELQQRVEEVLSLVAYGETTAGAVVVMNPLTGEIQAMASYPSYDLNLFTRGISSADYNALLNDEAKPLINRVTQGLYPPGSVFKAFTAAATLDNGVLDTGYVFNYNIDDDYWTPTQYGDWIWTPIKRTTMRARTEPLNMHNAILNSDNIYFAYAALQLGSERFLEYMEKLGFASELPFDINVADAQLINEGTDVSLKLLADSGYGQGEILTTPLQLATAFCAFANGGDICAPRIVKGLYRVDSARYETEYESERTLWLEDVISDEAIARILPMLTDVTRSDLNGTGRKLGVTSCTVAAKTGTAEIGDDKSREISWFAGFRTGVSDEDARLVLVMFEITTDDSDLGTLKFDVARELLKMSAP